MARGVNDGVVADLPGGEKLHLVPAHIGREAPERVAEVVLVGGRKAERLDLAERDGRVVRGRVVLVVVYEERGISARLLVDVAEGDHRLQQGRAREPMVGPERRA